MPGCQRKIKKQVTNKDQGGSPVFGERNEIVVVIEEKIKMAYLILSCYHKTLNLILPILIALPVDKPKICAFRDPQIIWD